jgi:hypothetical protein
MSLSLEGIELGLLLCVYLLQLVEVIIRMLLKTLKPAVSCL